MPGSFLPPSELPEPLHASGSHAVASASATSSTPAMTAAVSDTHIIATFLREHDNPHTRRAYGKEVARFLVFAEMHDKRLCDIRREDLQAYRDMLAAEIPVALVSVRVVPRLLPEGAVNRAYRPFAKKTLGASSQRLALLAIGAFFKFAHELGYLPGNPAIGLKPPRPARKALVERMLSADQVAHVIGTLVAMAPATATARRERLRNIFLMRLLFGTGARLSEVARASMGDIDRENGLWWFHIRHGKRDQERRVPVSGEVLDAFHAYRSLYGAVSANLPLMLSARGAKPVGIGDDAIALAVKGTFALAADALAECGAHEEAERLRQASTHWLRHAHISHLLNVKGVPAAVVQKNAGHRSLSTLDIYSHDDDNLRHRLIVTD